MIGGLEQPAAPGLYNRYCGTGEDEQFGRPRVEHVIAKNWDRSAQEIVDALFAATQEFSAGAPVFDDQTVVVLKVK